MLLIPPFYKETLGKAILGVLLGYSTAQTFPTDVAPQTNKLSNHCVVASDVYCTVLFASPFVRVVHIELCFQHFICMGCCEPLLLDNFGVTLYQSFMERCLSMGRGAAPSKDSKARAKPHALTVSLFQKGA